MVMLLPFRMLGGLFCLAAAILACHASVLSGAPPAVRNPFLPSGQADHGWPFVRGANFDGRSPETHLADEWPVKGPPVLWVRALGQGYSSFVAWGDRVATQYQTLAGQYVLCLNADTGETLWRHWYDWPYEPAGVYPGPRATPTYVDGWLYFASPSGLVGCLDAQTGTRRWAVNVVERFHGEGAGFGYSCSPTVIAGKVVLPVGGRGASIVALDSASGSLVWKAGDDAASYTPAYPIRFRDRALILGYLQNVLVAHDLESGKLLWRRELSSGYDEHSAWPIYAEPHVWISGPFQAGSELLELTDDPSQPVRLVRHSAMMSNDIFSSVLVDGAIYGFDLREAQAKTHRPSRGQFRCIDFLSGKEHWSNGDAKIRRGKSSDAREAVVGHATVIVADGKLILMNDTGELILARATRERYEELARTAVLSGEICWTQPALHRGRLFVRNQSQAACIYLGDPNLLEPPIHRSALTTADIPQTPYVDIAGMMLGVEPEYAFDIPSRAWLWRWYVTSLVGVLGGSYAVVAVVQSMRPELLTPTRARVMFWILAFVAGALGTTVLSVQFNDFIFTWPVSLFVAFQALVWRVDLKAKVLVEERSWRTLGVAAGFLIVCLAYFFVCRRLSLVFEWAFLCGFAGAAPFSLASKFWLQNRRWTWLWEVVATAGAFTGFFWLSALVLLVR
jgi:outer membrane protein assembly factor BamB